MAARTTIAFTEYIDQSALYQRHDVLVAGPDDILDDQQFCLEIENVLFSNCAGLFFTTTSTSFSAFPETCRFRGRDLCGVATTETGKAYVYLWSSAAEDFTVRLNDGTTDFDIAVTSSETSKIWRGSFDVTLNTDSNGIMTFTINAKRDGAAATVIVAGVAIYS